MKQEKSQKSKKWLLPVIIVAALLVVAGVVLALVLGGGQQTDPAGASGGRPQLYWNIEREQYIEEETGMSLRTKGEDGLYHILFAHDGQQVDLKVADKRIVNYIETLDLMGLAFDAEGIIVDVVSPETIATEVAKRFYVSKVTDTAITLNSSYAMNGMEKEIAVTDMLGIYDMDPNAEVIGAAAEIGLMDEVTVYGNEMNEPTHMYILTRAPEAGIYWRVTRMYDTEKGMTTREPDENGVYTIQFSHKGELVDLKCKDKALVTTIDAKAPLIGEVALVFDNEGYIIATENVALALRGKLYAQDYHVVGVDGDQITVERISTGSDQGRVLTFTLSETCEIFQCCQFGCYNEHSGEKTDHLKLYDRLNIYSDLENNPIMIHVTRRHVDSPMYYSLKRMYTSENGGGTTREKDAAGYYVFEMLAEDKPVTVRTKDKAIADEIDSYYHNCVGLELNGDVITRVYRAECVSGSGSPGYRRIVTSLTGGIFTLTNATDPTLVANCIMAEDCKIYDITGNPGVKKGTPTELKLNDRVIAWYDYAQKINYLYVTDREMTVRDYCQYCKKNVVWAVANKSGLATQDSGEHLHLVLGEDVDVEWGYATLSKGTTICLNLYGSNIRHTGRIMVAGGSKLNIMGKGSVVSSGLHKNQALLTGAITVTDGEVNIYSGTFNSENKAMPTINVNGKNAVVNLLGGTVNGGVDINNGQMNLGGTAKVIGAKGQLKDNIYVGTTGKLNVKADWSGEASVKVAITTADGISKSFVTSDGEYTGKLYYESKGNPMVVGKDGGVAVMGEIIPEDDDPDYRFCEHCGKRVMWSPAPVSGHSTVDSGEHIHYYMIADFGNDWGYAVLQKNTTICLDLNGHTINQTGRILVADAELNIMGEGKITARAGKNASLNTGAITIFKGTVNLYGGTYATDNPNAPAIFMNSGTATVNLYGGNVTGGIKAGFGAVSLNKTATVNGAFGKNIYIGDSAKLTVSGDWTGTAGVAFSYVDSNPISNASCTGNYTGKLTLEEDDGYQILPQDGKLYIPGYTIKEQTPIEPNFPKDVANDITSEAWCEACQKNVTWTSASSGLSARSDGGKHHLFVSGSRTESDPLPWQLGTISNNTTVCLYLNDTETVHNGRLFILGGSTVNLMGKGTLTTNGTSTSASALTGGITINEGTVNVLGDVVLKSINASVPAVSTQFAKATLNLSDGSVIAGGALVKNGVLNLSGNAQADIIGVMDQGKLAVDESFSGAAEVAFQNIFENPISNSICTGEFSGKLTMTEGDTVYNLIHQDGKLYIPNYTIKEPEPIAPNFPVDVANGAESEAWCEACKKNVIWIAASSGLAERSDGGHHHLFISGSRTESNPLTWQLGTINSNTTVCLYLNNTETYHNGRLFVLGGSTVNIMGKGTLATNGTSTTSGALTGGITVNQGTVNVLGDICLKSTAADVPAVSVKFASAAVNMVSGTISGKAAVDNGKLTLSGSTAVDTITVAATGKLEVKADWTGTANVVFKGLEENPVPNTICSGAFTGKLTTTIGENTYDVVEKSGKLYISGIEGDILPEAPIAPNFPLDAKNDTESEAWCEACKKNVIWLAASSGLSSRADGGHHHLFVSSSRTESNPLTWQLGTINSNTTVCLYLNNTETYHNGRLFVLGGSTVNIMGAGTLATNGTSTASGALTGGITVNEGTINVLGDICLKSTSADVPAVSTKFANATINMASGSIVGGAVADNGKLILSGNATADTITVAEAAKLEVKADWTGTAKVTFANISENPVASGISTGNYTGKLTTTIGGTEYDVIAQEGKLLISGYTVSGGGDAPVDPPVDPPVEPENGKLVLDTSNVGYCEACGQDVVWSAAATGGLSTKNDNAHHHLYLSETFNKTWGYLVLQNNTKICLHLNGFNIEQKGRIYLSGSGVVLNIMGGGTVATVVAHTNTDLNTGAITVNSGAVLNLYSGTCSSSVDGIPAVRVLGGVCTLGGKATVDSMIVAAAGKVNVKTGWEGTANVEFENELIDGEVPAVNGSNEGSFTGTLKLADGKKLVAKDGGLALEEAGAEDENLDPEVKKGLQIAATANAMTFPANGDDVVADCPACGAQQVTWVAKGNGMSEVKTGAVHYYIPADKTLTWGYGTLNGETTVCLHLNGTTMTHAHRVLVANGATLNIMGNGALISNGTGSAANVTGNITVRKGTVNLYGGTYISTASNGAPAIFLEHADAIVNIYSGATIGGETDGVTTNVSITNGTVNLYGGTIRNGVTASHGGNVVVGSGTSTTTTAVFNMVDGLITGGKAYTSTYAKGGNVMVYGSNGKETATQFNMTGGTIKNGAAVYGGNIAVQYATASISGNIADGVGTPSEGYKNPWGGNMYICNNSVVTLNGTVTGGTGVYCGSVNVAATATLIMNGGSISGGVGTQNAGNVRVDGTFIMNDGTISGGGVEGDAHGSHNVYANNGTVIFNGGRIEATNGTALSGTGLFLNGTSTARLSGNATVVREDGVAQGCIVLAGTAKLEVLNDWTGTASISFGSNKAYGDVIANAQCGSLVEDVFTPGGSYSGTLLNEKGDLAKVLGTDGVMALEAAPVSE